MVPAIIVAQLWGVIQLIILASLARTVRVRTVLAAMAVGFYAIGPFTAFVQLSWIHLAAPLFHMSPYELQALAAYSIDPFIEEAMKLLPLALLMLIPAVRRQWSITDCVLIAAATGSGFGLTEHLFRYSAYPHTAHAVAGGWVLPLGFNRVFVPGFFHTLTSWVTNGAYIVTDPIDINWHLAWSAIGGLAVGLVVRKGGRKALLIAAGMFVLIGLDHAAGNAPGIQNTWLAHLAMPMHLFTISLGILVFATLVVAWLLDQPAQRAGIALGPLLANEESASSHIVGTFGAALSRFPWSMPWVCGFDRARRAYHAARAANPSEPDDMRAALIAHRDSVEQRLKQSGRPDLLPSWLKPSYRMNNIRAALKRPQVIIWLVLITPSLLFVIGGWPQTAGIQRLLASSYVWPLILLITVANQSRVAWRVIKGISRLPATARLPIGDDAAILSLQLACGIGAVTLGGFTLVRVLSGVGSTQGILRAHALDALGRATASSITAAANSLTAGAPPSASPNAPQGSPSSNAAPANNAPPPDPNLPYGSPSNDSAPPEESEDETTWQPPKTIEDLEREINERNNPPIDYGDSPALPPDPQEEFDRKIDDYMAAHPWYNPTEPPELLDASAVGGIGPAPGTPQIPDASAIGGVGPPAPEIPDASAVGGVGPPPVIPDASAVGGAAPATPSDSQAEDYSPPIPPTPRAPPPALTPDQQADAAAAAATQAAADAQDAAAARTQAYKDADSASIRQATADPSSDPDVADAQARARAAHDAADAASVAASDPADPWNPTTKDAQNQTAKAAEDADRAERDAENNFQKQQDANNAAAQQAAKDADANANAADAAAADAKQAAAHAQTAANNADAKAASDAARAANPAQAAADDAAKEYATAQERENNAFFQKGEQQYHDARAAMDAARVKAEAAQAAADAAKNKGASSTVIPPKKP